jgi:diguanylate cyclase (GGDEF)-like protein
LFLLYIIICRYAARNAGDTMSETQEAEENALLRNAKRDQLIAENEALRASLDDMRLRVAELERLADTDSLTPLPNRRCFMREVERVVRHVARYGTSAAVMYVDLDGLKAINDQWGHQAGDAVLLHVAAVLRRDLRATDMVARIGGDEFGLLLDPVDEAAAQAKLSVISDNVLRTPIDLGRRVINVGVSIGLTMITADDALESVLARADAEMYRAKAVQRSDR